MTSMYFLCVKCIVEQQRSIKKRSILALQVSQVSIKKTNFPYFSRERSTTPHHSVYVSIHSKDVNEPAIGPAVN